MDKSFEVDASLEEIGQRLTGLHRRILSGLKEKGPGLVVDIAVRALAFPEEIAGPLHELQEWQLVRGDAIDGGPLGSTLYSLTRSGAALALQATTVEGDITQGDKVVKLQDGSDALMQQVELHGKLADTLKQKGDLEAAIRHYEQALNLSARVLRDREHGLDD